MKRLFVILAFLYLLFVSACASKASPAISDGNKSQSVPSISSEVYPKEIYSDDLISMSFVKKYDVPATKGMLYFDVQATNKSNQEITIYLQDAYMNDVQFQAGSGMPLDLLPGKNATHTFIGKYEGTKIKSADEIKKIGFKILVMDEFSKTLETTNSVEINF